MGELLAELDQNWIAHHGKSSGAACSSRHRGSHAFICDAWRIDWWGHTDQDQLPWSLMVLQLYPGHVIVHRPTTNQCEHAHRSAGRISYVRTARDTSDPGARVWPYCVLARAAYGSARAGNVGYSDVLARRRRRLQAEPVVRCVVTSLVTRRGPDPPRPLRAQCQRRRRVCGGAGTARAGSLDASLDSDLSADSALYYTELYPRRDPDR